MGLTHQEEEKQTQGNECTENQTQTATLHFYCTTKGEPPLTSFGGLVSMSIQLIAKILSMIESHSTFSQMEGGRWCPASTSHSGPPRPCPARPPPPSPICPTRRMTPTTPSSHSPMTSRQRR